MTRYICIDVGSITQLWIQLGTPIIYFVIWVIILVCNEIASRHRRSKQYLLWQNENGSGDGSVNRTGNENGDAEGASDTESFTVASLQKRPVSLFARLIDDDNNSDYDSATRYSVKRSIAFNIKKDGFSSSAATSTAASTGAGGAAAATAGAMINTGENDDNNSSTGTYYSSASGVAREHQFQELCRRYRFIRSLSLLLLFSYETLTVQALQIVNCISVGSCGRVLADYPDISCPDGPGYLPLLVVAVIVLCYCAAFPFVLLHKLYQMQSKMSNRDHRQLVLLAKYGVFFDQFKPEFWWWEVQV